MTEFLPGLPADALRAALSRAPGNELASGKFASPDSSSALAVNAFGWFLDRAAALPPLPGVPMGQPTTVEIAAEMHYPWKGGRHPWLDVALTTATTLVGVRSTRYDPFRPAKTTAFTEPFASRDLGPGMAGYDALRAGLAEGRLSYRHLDAAQLVKAAYGLKNQAHRRARGAVLVYLHAAPVLWSNGKPVDPQAIRRHTAEIRDLAARLKGQDVTFTPLRWSDLVAQWSATPALYPHAAAITARFGAL